MSTKGPHSQVEDLARKAALQERSWMQNPASAATRTHPQAFSELTIVSLPVRRFFEDISFFAVLDPTEKPGTRSVVVAVTSDERAFTIRSKEDFQSLLARSGRRIGSTMEAMEVAEQYVLLLGGGYPQYAESVRILRSAGDIPLNAGEVLPRDLNVRVEPPRFEAIRTGVAGSLFAWTEVGGKLWKFDFRFSEAGGFNVSQQLIGEGLGKAWLPK